MIHIFDLFHMAIIRVAIDLLVTTMRLSTVLPTSTGWAMSLPRILIDQAAMIAAIDQATMHMSDIVRMAVGPELTMMHVPHTDRMAIDRAAMQAIDQTATPDIARAEIAHSTKDTLNMARMAIDQSTMHMSGICQVAIIAITQAARRTSGIFRMTIDRAMMMMHESKTGRVADEEEMRISNIPCVAIDTMM